MIKYLTIAVVVSIFIPAGAVFAQTLRPLIPCELTHDDQSVCNVSIEHVRDTTYRVTLENLSDYPQRAMAVDVLLKDGVRCQGMNYRATVRGNEMRFQLGVIPPQQSVEVVLRLANIPEGASPFSARCGIVAPAVPERYFTKGKDTGKRMLWN